MKTSGPASAILIALVVVGAMGTTRNAISDEHASQSQEPPIHWQPGPTTVNLGTVAEMDVPSGYLFADKAGTLKLLELTHNLPSGDEVGTIVPAGEDSTDGWFVIFEFNGVGYVKDDEKNKINAGALLKSIREGTEEANKERRKKGWHAFTVSGWEKPPYYDSNTHNLTWAIRGVSEDGRASINHSVRILGRRGTMNVDLVQAPAYYAVNMPRFESVMSGFRFKQGSRYSDFVNGDKIAAYGLTALIAGGAGAVAVKTGLLASFWKVFLGIALMLKKVLVIIVLAASAFVKRVWGKLTGRPEEPGRSPGPGSPEPGPPDPIA